MASQSQNKLKQLQALREIGSGGAPVKAKCGLCGSEIARYRHVRKSHRELSTGYYRPRLSVEEMFVLPDGAEVAICVDRGACRERRSGRQ